MRFVFILSGLLLCTTLFSQNLYACECSWEDQNINKAKAKKFYLEKFQGSVFSGKVIDIAEKFDGQKVFREITIQVEKRYSGANNQQVTIYSSKWGCGISDFEKGKKFFFVAHLENGKLVSTVCDYLFKDFFTEKEFSKIFAKTKTFKNK